VFPVIMLNYHNIFSLNQLPFPFAIQYFVCSFGKFPEVFIYNLPEMRVKFCLFVLFLLIKSSLLFSQVAINADGSSPNNSAMLDVKSNNKGFLPPRMTHAEMNAIPNPADGLIVYCTDCRPDGKGVLSTFTDGNWSILNLNCLSPLTPTMAINVPTATSVVWDWKGVPYASGYRWNISNNYATATLMDTVTSKAETGLTCSSTYTRYVWAYNTCGYSLPLTLTQPTLACSVPTLTTIVASAIGSTTATSGGNITEDGGATVTDRGVCWGTAPNPTITDSRTSDGTELGSFTSHLINLTKNTTYYIRAYATNSVGPGYGNEITIKTLATLGPIIFNPDLTYGTMTDYDGNIYKTITIGTHTWMAENLRTTKYRNGDLIDNVTDNAAWIALSTGAYCWNNNDVASYKAIYGALYNWYAVADSRKIAPEGWHVPTDAEWTTLIDYFGGWYAGGELKETGMEHWASPNTSATNGSGFTALPGGDRFYDGGTFNDVGRTGLWWSSTSFDATMAWCRKLGYYGALFVNGYYVKQYGFSVRCIKDYPVVPNLTTTEASAIASATAIIGGNISSDGGSEVTARGVCWATTANPTTANSKTSDGTGIGIFTSSLTGLTENTTYYLRAYATNSTGTGYGNEITFKTLTSISPIIFNPDLSYGTMTDNDGNVYKTITIGTQTWMAENLKTTKYRNGDAIPNLTGDWSVLVTGTYCWYNNDAATYKNPYGALYNWYAIADSRNIAPVGWHVPTDAEWTTLTTYLGGESIAGGKLKETGTSHWSTPNTGATNNTGFTALPGGDRSYDGTFHNNGYNGYWWSSAEYSASSAWYRGMRYDYSRVSRYSDFKYWGFSVRCLRD